MISDLECLPSILERHKKGRRLDWRRPFSLSLLYQQYTCSTVNLLFTNVWQQGHEACSLDRSGDSMLTGRGTTALSTADDSALAIDHFLEQFHVLVIDKHGTWTLTIHENRIFFSGS